MLLFTAPLLSVYIKLITIKKIFLTGYISTFSAYRTYLMSLYEGGSIGLVV